MSEPHYAADSAALESGPREATLLYPRLLVLVSVGMLLYIPLVVLVGGPPAQVFGPCGVLVGCAVSWLVSKRGHVRLAMLIIVWVLWAGILMQGALRGGLANAGFSSLAVVMLVAGWLLGLRQGIFVGAASLLGTLVLALAIDNGWLQPAPVQVGLSYWLPQAAVMLMSMTLMATLLRVHWRHLAQARRFARRNDQQRRLLSERESALLASEDRFLRIHETSPVPITLSRIEDGRYIDVNPAWEKLFGWTREQVRGRSSLDIGFFVDPADRERGAALFARDGRAQIELVAQTVTGERRTLACSVEQIIYDGKPAALTMLFDLTERQRAAEQLQRLNDELEARVATRTAELEAAVSELGTTLANLRRTQDDLIQAEKHAALGRLVAGVAHELNTPIGNALTASTALSDELNRFTARLQEGALKRSQLQSLLDIGVEGSELIERSLRRAASLVQSFKQVAIDQASEQRRQFCLAELVREVVATMRPTYRQIDWRVDIDIPETLSMESYAGALEQVLMHLIGNALTHGFAERGAGCIALSARLVADDAVIGADGAGVVTLQCRDDGVGIATENLGRVFDPFFTTQLGRGSSGLGLAIVQQLATRLLGGQIDVESTPGAGTIFTLRMPAVIGTNLTATTKANVTDAAVSNPLGVSAA